MQFDKLYDNTWVVMIDFCTMNLVEAKEDETPRETVFIPNPFHEASYGENSNEIKYPQTFD